MAPACGLGNGTGPGVQAVANFGGLALLVDGPTQFGGPVQNLQGIGTSGPGLQGASNTGPGVMGKATTGSGVQGQGGSGPGVWGISLGSGPGVQADAGSGLALLVNGPAQFNGPVQMTQPPSGNSAGVQGTSGGGAGVQGSSTTGPGVQGAGSASGAAGVNGQHTGSGPGVQGTGNSGAGVSGSSTSGHGVLGTGNASGAAGVSGQHTAAGPGVKGSSGSGPGVQGVGNATGPGVLAQSSSGVALRAEGMLQVVGSAVGTATVPQGGTFLAPPTVTVTSPAATPNSTILLTPLSLPYSLFWIKARAAGSFTISAVNPLPGSVTLQYLIIN